MSGWPWMKGIEVAIAEPLIKIPSPASSVGGQAPNDDGNNADDYDNDDDLVAGLVEEIKIDEEPEDEPTEENKKYVSSETQIDTRPVVKDLIQRHRSSIDELKTLVISHPLFDPTKHDDLWLLRFLLSHKDNVDRAYQAVKTTWKYRHDRKLDDVDVRFTPPTHVSVKHPKHHHQQHQQMQPEVEEQQDSTLPQPSASSGLQLFMEGAGVGSNGITLVVPDTKKRYGTIFYFNLVGIDTHGLALLSDEDWIAGMSTINEYSFQWLDYITRTTGRLTKAVHIVDISNVGFNMYNMTTQTKYTTAAKKLQDCYPQAVKAYLVCGAPYWIEAPWRALKPLLPERVISKLDFINPQLYEEDKLRLLEFVPESQLPVRFGGTCSIWPPPSITE